MWERKTKRQGERKGRENKDKDSGSFFKRVAVCGKKLYCKIESKQRENFSAVGKSPEFSRQTRVPVRNDK